MYTQISSFIQIRIIYAATILFLVALSVFTFIQLKNLTEAYIQINHTHQTTQLLQNVLTDILQSEDCKRGFLLSGDSLELRKRNLALNNLSKEYHALGHLIIDNPKQQDNLNVLTILINEKLASVFNMPLQLKKSFLSADTKQNTLFGVNKMDKVIAQIELMIAFEATFLLHIQGNYNQLSFITPLFMIVFFLGAIIILWASYLKLINALSVSEVLQDKLKIENEGKENLAAELVIANIELAFQVEEKGNLAAELIIANKTLHYESNAKEYRAAELVIANKELAFQVEEKECRAAELVIANKTLHYESSEKEDRAAELIDANKELAFQVREKENRAAELVTANAELAFQIGEKEKRELELINSNKELQSFAQIASHDLQEPLRKIQMFTSRIRDKDYTNLSDYGQKYFEIIEDAAERMQVLIQDLIAYAQTNDEERAFEETDLNVILKEVIEELSDAISEKGATVKLGNLCNAYIIPFQFHQLITNLISNSLKFAKQVLPCQITICSCVENGNNNVNKRLLAKRKYCHITYSDNGIGFEEIYNEKVFEIFQRLHGSGEYKGTGIGLAIVKKIVDNHKGIIKAFGKPNEGVTFDIYLPTK